MPRVCLAILNSEKFFAANEMVNCMKSSSNLTICVTDNKWRVGARIAAVLSIVNKKILKNSTM
jgi:hypothetical protein